MTPKFKIGQRLYFSDWNSPCTEEWEITGARHDTGDAIFGSWIYRLEPTAGDKRKIFRSEHFLIQFASEVQLV